MTTLGWDFKLFSQHIDDVQERWGRNGPPVSGDFMKAGKTIIAYHESVIEQALKNTIVVKFDTLRVGLLNYPKVLYSEIGHAICESESLNVDFSITWYVQPNGSVELSLRSRSDRIDIDVGAIAKNLGGGGHKTSSGAIVGIDFVKGLYAQQISS